MKFHYDVSEQNREVTVYFDGYYGSAKARPSDEFDAKKGVQIALFRAMKKRLFKNGKPAELYESYKVLAAEGFVQIGKIPDWKEWTARYAACLSYWRGVEEVYNQAGISLEGYLIQTTVSDGEFIKTSVDFVEYPDYLHPEEKFLMWNSPPVVLE